MVVSIGAGSRGPLAGDETADPIPFPIHHDGNRNSQAIWLKLSKSNDFISDSSNVDFPLPRRPISANLLG